MFNVQCVPILIIRLERDLTVYYFLYRYHHTAKLENWTCVVALSHNEKVKEGDRKGGGRSQFYSNLPPTTSYLSH